MKRYLFLLFGLFSLGGWTQSLPSTENYIYTKICLSADCVKKSETVQYYDGLGRPKQIVGVKATPKGRDLVTPIEYDAFGRQAKDYLPIPQSGTLGGNIYANPQSNASATYGSEKIYAEKIFENSPLDRVLAQVQVGNDWSNRPINFGYDANTTADAVKKYTTSTTWADGATVSILTLSGVYDNAQLYKNTVTDEDGNTTIEFKNGEGQTLLVRKTDGTQNIDTYYVYNEYNQLAFVIPPLAAAKPSLGTSDLDALCYQYRYDGKNRLVEKKLPGKGWEWMVYDQQDRLVLSQDALQRGKEWFFTKYDALGRVAYTGLFSNTASRVSMQTALSNMNVNRANNERRTDAPFTLNGATVYYTREAFPKSSFKLLSVNYYDTYPADAPAVPTNIMGQETLKPTITNNRSTKGLPTAVYLKNLEDDAWTKTYTYYDTKARPIATHSINHLGGYTKTESLLDFSGVALSQNTTHKRDAGSSEVKVAERLTYDHQNRLLQHYHKVDSGVEELLANHTYDELGRVAVKKVGGSIGAPLQQLDYSYNIRGWLTKLNRPEALGTDLFGFELRYQNPVASDAKQQPRYNGNIAQMDWVSRQDGQLRRYTYQYDPLNRLRNAYYSKPNATVPITNAYNEYLAYDANGNITTLHRFGGSDQNMAVKIDQLTYTYNGNQLTEVVDATRNISGYPLGGNAITYDANGNMTSLLDKKISRIGYNTLNLPNQVQSAAGNLSYTYRADGVKVSQQRTIPNGFIRKDYIAGFHHETKEETMYIGNPVEPQEPILVVGDSFEKKPTPPSQTSVTQRLLFFPTAEGYYDYLHKRYVYHYTDHLGNVRLSYYRSSNGNLTIDKESNYYPFGLEHTGYNGLLGNQRYNYKYNGKELQTEIGMYDYGARFYMPDLGRWGVVDPLAEETMELYSYVKNNPIMLIDPTGMEAEDPEDPPKKSKYIGQIYKDGTGTFVGGKDGSWNATRNDGSKETIIPEVIITKSNSDDFVKNTLDKVGNVNDVIDNTGSSLQANAGLTRLGSNRKLYFETLNGGVFKGNQYVSTTSVIKYGSRITRVTGPIGYAISVGQIGYGVYKDGGDFGNNAKVATGGVVGGFAGGLLGAKVGGIVGAKAGAFIGVWFGGIGAAPGAAIGGVVGGIIGGVSGGYYGGEYGEQITREHIKK
ncbi:DUF6443 domain-containing protein [Riemerella anatipestifer]|nr:DUF6443 domain-containing protein [Riemerella anatipestifer]